MGHYNEGLELLGGVPLGEPIKVAAAAPRGEVLAIDGAAAKPSDEDGLNFRLAVEPGNELEAGGPVQELAVEFIADGPGKTGDFTDAPHVRSSWANG